jgi:hypothetical protein
MGDIVIKINIPGIKKEVARRSSIATETDPFYKNMSTEKKQLSQLHGEGDRITEDFIKEAAKEVQKAYLNRQGDVAGLAFEYNRTISAGGTAVKQKETVTLTGTDGSAYITEIAPVDKKITFTTDLDTTADNFVLDNADYYDNLGIVVTAGTATLVFEAKVAGVPFNAPVVSFNEGTLVGTTATTTANQTAGEVTTNEIIYRVAESVSPLTVSMTNAIIERLTKNTKDAIIYYVLVSLYRTDGNEAKEMKLHAKALELIDNLSGDLYKLHD